MADGAASQAGEGGEIRASAGGWIICVSLSWPAFGFRVFLVRDRICVDVTLK